MAELDFSHNVSEIPAGQPVPKPLERREQVQSYGTPDIQGAVEKNAEATNFMSSIGSFVASKASNAVAEKLGTQLGKNPKGDIGIPLTDFDKVMQESYSTQAQATLGLQANKLITDSNIAMAKASRITPDLIQKTNSSVTSGLQNIFKNAPAKVQSNLETHFGNLQLSQTEELSKRMFQEQKQDRVNNTALASQMNTEHAYTFGMQGNDKAALAAIATTESMCKANVAANIMTPVEAKSKVDAARASYQSGKIIHDYQAKKAEGKDTEFLRDVADGKVIKLDDPHYMAISGSLQAFVSHQDALRAQDESLSVAKFNTSVAMNPLAPDMAQQLEDLKSKVSAEVFEKSQLDYLSAVKTFNTENGNTNEATKSWSDSSAFARLTEKGINSSFDQQTARLVQQKQDQGKPISPEEAKVQIATSAGGRIPVYEKELQNNLLSGHPASILSATNQMQLLNHMEAGHVYEGVSTKAKAVAALFQQQRGSMPDADLARKITDNLSNVDNTLQKTLDNSWNIILSTKGVGGLGAHKSFAEFGLQAVGYNKNDVGGAYFATIYGNDIYNELNSNYIATRGDYDAAVKMTQDTVKQRYGETYVNGTKQISDSPIEKFLGYKGNAVTPYVQKDLLNSLAPRFEQAKKDHPDDYWEVLPLKGNTAEVSRHIKTKDGVKEYRYPVHLVGRAGNQWDVVVQTPYAQHNLFLVAPHVGVTSYKPNKEAIDKDFKSNRRIGHDTLRSILGRS